MENKYYTPEIEEFHVGFEYESRLNDGWEKKIYKQNSFLSVYADAEYSFDNIEGSIEIRVKYLDREDIESFDWELDSVVEGEAFYIHKSNTPGSIKEWLLVFREKEFSIEIFDAKDNTNTFNFYGILKNKSEFKRLMVQLGINQ